MIDIKALARGFVVEQLRARETFFTAAWDLLFHRTGPQSALPMPPRHLPPLGIAGDEYHPAVLATQLFIDAARQTPPPDSLASLLTAVERASENYHVAEWELRSMLRRLREYLTSSGLPPAPSTEVAAYARMWTNKTRTNGEAIQRATFAQLDEEKASFDVFIIDKGEFRSDSYGAVFFSTGHPPRRKCEQIALRPLEYRILVTALKGGGVAGDALTLARECWSDQPIVATNLESADTKDRDAAFGRIRQAAGRLESILYAAFRVRFRTFKTRKYRLSPTPTFCLIELFRA